MTAQETIAASQKKLIYVGGLDENVDENVLAAAFRPFGELQQVLVPKDQSTKRHRGFGFVEFVDSIDAQSALDNMHDSELYGRVLKCNFARPSAAMGGGGGGIWAQQAAEEWMSSGVVPKSADEIDRQIHHVQATEAKTMTKTNQ